MKAFALLALPGALAFAPGVHSPGARPALRRNMASVMKCEDNICYALASAKPESVEKLSSAKLQQQVELLQSQLAIDKAVAAGDAPPAAAAVADAGCSDNVCYALQNVKPGAVEKLSEAQLQEQISLLQSRLELDQARLAGVPPAAPAVAAAPEPSPVISTPSVAEPVAVPEPPMAVPEPPASVPAPVAEEAPKAAAKSLQELMDAGDDAGMRAYFGLPEKAATPAPPVPEASSSSPFGLPKLPELGLPKLPELGGAPQMPEASSSGSPFGLPKLPDFSGAALGGGGAAQQQAPAASSSGSPFGLPSLPSLPSAPKLPDGESFDLPEAGGLSLPSLPKLPEVGLPDFSALSSTNAEPISGSLSAADVPWGAFLLAFTLFPAAVILISKVLEMVGVTKPPGPPPPRF